MSTGATEPSIGSQTIAWSAAPPPSRLEPADVSVVFRRQARPLLARHRVAYRTGLVVLVLSRFNQGAAQLGNLHTVMWALRSTRTRNMFDAWWRGRQFISTSTDRIDPDLQVTLNLAIVDRLVEPASNGSRVRLTEGGQRLAERIEDEEQLMRREKEFLSELGRLSDAAMSRRLSGGRA